MPMFNSESRSISTHNVKRLVLNSCVAFRKLLIRDANPKNSFTLIRSIKIGVSGKGKT